MDEKVAKLIGKIIGLIINIIMIPILIVTAIPMGILKARRAQQSRLLFTGYEQALLAKAQMAINMENNGLISPNEELLEVAKCIESARCDYQIIKSQEHFDRTFLEFVIPKIEECYVIEWVDVIDYLGLSKIAIANTEGGVTWKTNDPTPKNEKINVFDDDIPF